MHSLLNNSVYYLFKKYIFQIISFIFSLGEAAIFFLVARPLRGGGRARPLRKKEFLKIYLYILAHKLRRKFVFFLSKSVSGFLRRKKKVPMALPLLTKLFSKSFSKIDIWLDNHSMFLMLSKPMYLWKLYKSGRLQNIFFKWHKNCLEKCIYICV